MRAVVAESAEVLGDRARAAVAEREVILLGPARIGHTDDAHARGDVSNARELGE